MSDTKSRMSKELAAGIAEAVQMFRTLEKAGIPIVAKRGMGDIATRIADARFLCDFCKTNGLIPGDKPRS